VVSGELPPFNDQSSIQSILYFGATENRVSPSANVALQLRNACTHTRGNKKIITIKVHIMKWG
jgi:hypothetical protein